MTDALALVCMLLALPGLLLPRFGPLTVRLLTLGALAVILCAALNFERVVEEEVPARIALVGTGVPAPVDDLRTRIAGPMTQVEVVARAPWPERLVLGAMHAGPRAEELALLWTGPLPDPVLPISDLRAGIREGALLTGRGFTALVPDTSLDLDPEQLQAWPVGGFEVDRPAALEVRFAGANQGLLAEITVFDPLGNEVVSQAVELEPEANVVEVPLVPSSAGVHDVRLLTEVGGVTLQRQGSFNVAAPRPVMVVGGGAAQVASALEVQGMMVASSPTVPRELSSWSVLVVLGPVVHEDQERLSAYLDGGGGLFLVGGQPGALPETDEPLYEILPVLRLDRELAEPEGEEEGPETAQDDPPEEEIEEELPPTPPEPPENPDPPVGEVKETELDPTEEEEVDRRVVGMVLVVDRSGSMGERVPGGQLIKMDYAKRSAVATADALQEGDELGIVTFGNRGFGRTELPMAPVTDRAEIRDGVSRLRHAVESTFLSSGLERAAELLGRSVAPVRFIVVITDGVFQDDVLAIRTARELAAEGITVSLIQIVGSGAVGAVQSQRLTDAGQGNYMRTTTAREVPRLVVLEVGRALGRIGREPHGPADPEAPAPDPEEAPPDVAETEPTPPEVPPEPDPTDTPEPEGETRLRVRAVVDSVLLEPLPPDGFPDLGGMEPVVGRPDSHVLLVGGDEGLPVLAFANRGLGRIGVWTADFTGPWGGEWRNDPEFPGRLATWIQSLFPPLEATPEDLLTLSSIQPVVPTPKDLAILAQLATGPVRPLSEYRAPGPMTQLTAQGMAQELAIAAALGLLVLALGEYLLLRWQTP